MVMENKSPFEKFPQVYVQTPLIESISMRQYAAGHRIFIKAENCQPSGSFKLRGISAQVKDAKVNGYTKIVMASNGNAGLAAAYSALQLSMDCHIVAPHKTPKSTVDSMKQFGATVEIFSDSETEVAERAQLFAKLNTSALIEASDSKLAWRANSLIVEEVASDLGAGVVPSLIVANCGGGGLVCGLVEGIRKRGWEQKTKILVMETTGTGSFNAMVRAQGKCVKLEPNSMHSSIACSLKEPQVIEKVSQCFLESKPPLLSRLVADKDAVAACLRFANDHRFLVGPACGTTLAAVYGGVVGRLLTNDESEHETIFDRIDHEDFNHGNDGPVVVIVDGGAEISLEVLAEYKRQFAL